MRLAGKVVIGVVLIGVSFGMAFSFAGLGELMEEGQQSKSYRTELVSVDSHDLAALREWARLTCRGRTVAVMAASLEVEPTMEAILGFLSKGLPEESQLAVREVCERELIQAEKVKELPVQTKSRR